MNAGARGVGGGQAFSVGLNRLSTPLTFSAAPAGHLDSVGHFPVIYAALLAPPGGADGTLLPTVSLRSRGDKRCWEEGSHTEKLGKGEWTPEKENEAQRLVKDL